MGAGETRSDAAPRPVAALAAVAASVAVPALLWLAWSGRDRPPDWSCGMEEPAGWDAAAADWLAGLGPAFGAATLLLLALVLRLSFERRRAAGLPSRPGLVAAVAAVPAGFYAWTAAFSAEALDPLAEAAWLLLLSAPVLLVALVCALIWAGSQDGPARAPAAAQVGVWVALLVTTLVTAGVLWEASGPSWCWD